MARKLRLHLPDNLGLYLIGAFFGLVHGPFLWVILLVLLWYISKIPQRKLPLTRVLATQHAKFYTFAGKIIKSVLLSSVGIFAVTSLPIVLSVAMGILPVLALGLLQVLAFIATVVALAIVKEMDYDPLLRFAEAGARALVGSEEYDKMSEEERAKVKRNLVDSQIGINKGTMVIAQGQVITKNEPAQNLARFGGPGVLIVQDGHAVVLEQSGRVSRVVGRGRTFLEPFERVSMVLPLNSQRETPLIKNVVTQDQVVIPSVQLYVFHRVDPGDRSHPNGLYPYDHKNILKLWSPKGGLWNNLVVSLAESVTRDLFARHTLDDIMMASAAVRTQLCEEIRCAINNALNSPFGILVTIVRIGEVEVPKDVEEKLRERWMANVNRQIEVIKAEQVRDTLVLKGDGQAQVLRKVEMIKATLRDTLIHQLTDPFGGPTSAIMQNKELAMRFIDAVERLSSSIMRDDVTALRYIEALENMAQSDGNKTFIVGDNKGFFESPSGEITSGL